MTLKMEKTINRHNQEVLRGKTTSSINMYNCRKSDDCPLKRLMFDGKHCLLCRSNDDLYWLDRRRIQKEETVTISL